MASVRAPRVVHLIVGSGSGVVAVVEDYIANTPELEHHALVVLDESCSVGRQLRRTADSVIALPTHPVQLIRALRAEVARIDPDVVHAHSSFAGAYARIALPRQRQAQVVYTPHGFSFQRTDVRRWTKAMFRVAESVLSFRGAHVVACSPHEARLAEALPGPHRVTYVPNVARPDDDAQPPDGRRAPRRALVATTAGRVTAAKAPEFFADAARHSQAQQLPIEWVWVGGQNDAEASERDLLGAGVRVTGWIPRPEARRLLADADVYVHCAAWEGAPITILEAADAGVPIVARRTPALEALGVAPLFDTVDELIAILAEYPNGPAFATARASLDGLRERHTSPRQRAALIGVYRRAVVSRRHAVPRAVRRRCRRRGGTRGTR